ncbi:HlyD family secretion protein [Geosporobacter subterraneus DSM 17957]|uniref:HlyD family secretion protein n=1 Tax=Geosporobacter subterraneus DSM 17957 TaxID=1121919 RepID=A0A1M6EVZ7_9FIRM|nr:efflux RND transporter periplasmic adaptor subunit [Geosporobacter subterraneus]SHI89539.1 HlyD family secretion protein [Geosporobacter subterraneus DSM 17957]
MKKAILLLVSILIFTVGCGKVENTRYTGTVEATQIDVSAELSGMIKEIMVSEGEQVEAGQLLGKLEDTALGLSTLQREAAYQAQTAQLADLKKGTRQEELNIAYQQIQGAEQLLRAAEDTFAYRKDLYETTREMFEQGAVPEQQMKDARYLMDQAEHSMENARKAFDTAVVKMELLERGVREDQIKAQEHLAEQSKRAYEQTKLQQDKTNINAPAKGVVLYKNFQLGEFLPMGAPLVTLIDLEDLWMNVYIPEKELYRVQLGQKIKLISDILKKNEFLGEVIFISPRSEFTPSNVITKEDRHNRVHEVKIKIIQGQTYLRPGMILDAELSE